jgi:hypothetical protein
MARSGKSKLNQNTNGANVVYKAKLWQMADALRGSVDVVKL